MKKAPSYCQRAAWVFGAVCVTLAIMLMIAIQTSRTSKSNASNPVTAVQSLLQGADTRFGHVQQEGYNAILKEFGRSTSTNGWTLKLAPIVDQAQLMIIKTGEGIYGSKSKVVDLGQIDSAFWNALSFFPSSDPTLLLSSIGFDGGETGYDNYYVFDTKNERLLTITAENPGDILINGGPYKQEADMKIALSPGFVKELLVFSGMTINGKTAFSFPRTYTEDLSKCDGLGCGAYSTGYPVGVSPDLSRVYFTSMVSDEKGSDDYKLVVNRLNGTMAELKDWPTTMIRITK